MLHAAYLRMLDDQRLAPLTVAASRAQFMSTIGLDQGHAAHMLLFREMEVSAIRYPDPTLPPRLTSSQARGPRRPEEDMRRSEQPTPVSAQRPVDQTSLHHHPNY